MTQPRHPDDPLQDDDELFTEEEERAPARETDASPDDSAHGTGGRLTTAVSSDELPYVDDRVSKFFVGAIVAVFAGIFAYGLLFGGAGALTPDASPTARPSREPSPSVSPASSPSGSPDASPTGSPSPDATAGGSPAASPSPVVSASPDPDGGPGASPTDSPDPASPSPNGT